MKRVWMNHWFSTAVNIIALLKLNENNVYVIGSNENEHSVIKNYCDEWYREPVLNDEEYVDFCLDFCKEHDIQYFMPRMGMLGISKHKEEFETIGTKIMVDDYPIVSTLNHKEKAYEFFKNHHIGSVPEYYIVTTADEFKDAYERLSGRYHQVCFKFVMDEGGKSFRYINNDKIEYSDMLKYQRTGIRLLDALNALSEKETFAPIMVMPYFRGVEVSVDCLNTDSGLIALPRVKGEGVYEVLRFDENILKLCNDFQDRAKLECPYNIQFIYHDGTPYFLEVNTRMSGGIQMACYASGVNIPQLALRKLANEKLTWSCNYDEKMIAHVLQPVVVS